MTEDMLNCRQVARLLAVSSAWVYLHVREDARPRLPHRRIGRTLRFSRPEIEAFIERGAYRLDERCSEGDSSEVRFLGVSQVLAETNTPAGSDRRAERKLNHG
jgi:predicted DNA-binding transcriptional regulator AlpA